MEEYLDIEADDLDAASGGSESFSSSESSQVVTPTPYDRIVSSSDTLSGQIDGLPTDIAILSADAVYFNVHSKKLVSSSNNGFNHLLLTSENDVLSNFVLSVPESSVVLAILLHTVYGVSCADPLPSSDDLIAAIVALKTYGMSLQIYISRGTPLFDALMLHAPSNALALYILAAATDLRDLAASASMYLLSVTLTSLSDEVTAQIHPIYLKRLFLLHADRVRTFKQLLVAAPDRHGPIPSCTAEQQSDRITGSWNRIVAYLSFIVRPDISWQIIEPAFYGIQNQLPCALCRHALAIRLQTLISQWSTVKATI